MAICKWCGEENADGVNVCSFCGQDMSIFEDSGMLKNINGAGNEPSRPRMSTTAGGASVNSGSFSSAAVRNATSRSQQVQQAQKKSEYVTRNQLKQVAYRLDSKSKTLSVLTAIIAIVAVISVVLGALSFVRTNAQADTTEADATIAQLQSKVSTLELELQTVNAKLAELQSSASVNVPSNDTSPVKPTEPVDADSNSGAVNITTTNDPVEPEPVEPTLPSTDTTDTEPTEVDTEIEYAFKKVDGDGTSVYAAVAQTFEGTTTYQWQKKANTSTSDNWTDVNTSAAKTDSLKISVDDYLRNNSYRCRVTNVDSKGVTTVYYTEVVDYNDYQIWALIG